MSTVEPTRERLVNAGVDLLEEVGVAGLGLRVIARTAGVSHGAPRRYFPTHRALLAAIAARGASDLLARFGQFPVGSVAPEDHVRSVALEYLDFASKRPEMFALLFRHDLLEGSGEELRKLTQPAFADFAELVAATKPGLPRTEVLQRAVLLWANLHGLAMLNPHRTLEPIVPELEAVQLVDLLLAIHLGR